MIPKLSSCYLPESFFTSFTQRYKKTFKTAAQHNAIKHFANILIYLENVFFSSFYPKLCVAEKFRFSTYHFTQLHRTKACVKFYLSKYKNHHQSNTDHDQHTVLLKQQKEKSCVRQTQSSRIFLVFNYVAD